jgi:hypothetical protein
VGHGPISQFPDVGPEIPVKLVSQINVMDVDIGPPVKESGVD